VIALGLGAFAATERQRANDAQDTAARVISVVTDPGRAEATGRVASGGAATVITADGQAVSRTVGLRELPSDRAYQLWRINDDGAQSLGVLGRGTGGSVQQFLDHVEASDQIGLTVEPSKGSQQPTTEPVLLLPMPA
jgi:hypothetical protein